VCHPILVLLHRGRDLLVPSRNRILELRGVIAHAILTAELSGIVPLDKATLLLKVNENVDGAVEFGGDGVAVVIARTLATRIALRSRGQRGYPLLFCLGKQSGQRRCHCLVCGPL
jgi:hypothetical protein